MKVLIACAYSGKERDEFAKRGHDAWSCDLLPSETPGNHYQGNVLDILNDGWDLMIAHPCCQFLSVSGMHWTTRGHRDPQLTEDALGFVQVLLNADIPKICLENPVSVISTRVRKPEQIVQPWMFGDDASKTTCLWLKGLPNLEVNISQVVPPRGWSKVMAAADMVECECCGEPFCPECNDHYADCECIGPMKDGVHTKTVRGVEFGTRTSPPPKMRWANQCDSGQNKLGPSKDRWKLRAETYAGMSKAFAEQWGLP